MDVADLLLELYGRIPPLVEDAVSGLKPDQLREAPRTGANPIGWLVWHLTRVQDHHVSEILEIPQEWETSDWPSRFGLDPDPENHGYGHDADQVAAVRPDGTDALTGYLATVQGRTVAYLEGLKPSDLDRVVDDRWTPPVTLGVRLVSVADDSLQHAGQAAYLRGLLDS